MKLPSAEEYLQIIDKKTPGSLATLHNYRFLLREDGKTYWHEKSRHAIVFKAELNSKWYAIRFFLHDDPEFFKRYQDIQNFLLNKSFSWKVPVQFLQEEFYPAVRMDWIDSFSLPEYLDSIITDPSKISRLQSKLTDLSANLEENGVGHGNLNLKHIRVVKRGQDIILKLIDYDSMFIPSFEGKDSMSAGTSSFQHPMRLSSDFSETIDRFSFWVFLTALEAFKTDPLLWTKATEHGYDQSKQILFNYRDLAIPQQSRAFQIIKSHNNEALNFYADKLMQFCTSKSLDAIEAPRLYGQSSYSVTRKERSIQEVRTAQETRVRPEPQEQKQTEQAAHSAVLPEQKAVLTQEREAKEKTVEKKENEFVHLKIEPQPKIRAKKKNKGGTIAAIAVAIVLALGSIYFINTRKNHTPETLTEASAAPQKLPVQISQKPKPQETVFTSANITQFLFQLYQSYNKRDLQAILSNYADNLLQYYDAGAVTKDKLSGIMKNLFITPAYYECRPDLRTLQFNVQGDVCTLTLKVNETIKAGRRSKTENYSSRIEYTINRSFKILGEKNISQ